MDTQKNLFHLLGEWWDGRQARRRETTAQPRPPHHLTAWLPSRGNMIFTLVMIALLVLAQSVGALPLPVTQHAPRSTSIGTIAYQGRLADAAGAPLTGAYNMIFRLYDAGTGGTPLWSEQWTGSNGVKVSDGLFNVMLGSLSQLPVSQFTNSQSIFLGITVGTDDEMAPRVQLGSVPFAVQALTVPDGSVTSAKIVDGAVTQAKLGDKSVSRAKVDFGVGELYRPDSLEGGACHDLIAHLQSQGFKQCMYVASPGSGFVPWHYQPDCSDPGVAEPNLWQKDGIWRLVHREGGGRAVYVQGTYEDQMPYLICVR